MIKQILFFLLLASCLHVALFAEGIQVSLSQNKIGLNESLTMTFSSREAGAERPNFAPLEADFTILSNTQTHHTTIINGKMDQENRWNLVLLPKREGQLHIPAIPFGKYSSEPLTIEVTAASVTSVDDEIFLETELQPQKESYEQAQLLYTVRLFRSVNVAQATLSEVKLNDPDAIIEKIGHDREYEHFQPDGRRYAVLERKYAIFPQKTGELVFSPIVFQGRVLKGGRSFFFDMEGQYKRVISPEEKVTIKSPPSPFTKSHWFPANDVALVSEWSADPGNLTLGEPVTLTLTLTAEGCLGTQIPDLAIPLPATLRQYPDKPQTTNQFNDKGIVGIKQTKIALIPSQSGEMTIPEISLKWWDLKSDQMKEVKLPATTLRIQGEAVAMNEVKSSPSMETSLPITVTEVTQPSSPSSHLTLWLSILIAFCMGIVGYILGRKIPQSDPFKGIKKEIKHACRKNDPKQAESALITWAGQQFPYEGHWNLIKLKQYVPEAFQAALSELYTVLYGKQAEWDGAALWQAFKAFKPKKQNQLTKKNCLLKDLYPN